MVEEGSRLGDHLTKAHHTQHAATIGDYLVARFGATGTHGFLAGVMALWTVGPLLLARRVTARRDV